MSVLFWKREMRWCEYLMRVAVADGRDGAGEVNMQAESS